jgi:hypothetical protein
VVVAAVVAESAPGQRVGRHARGERARELVERLRQCTGRGAPHLDGQGDPRQCQLARVQVEDVDEALDRAREALGAGARPAREALRGRQVGPGGDPLEALEVVERPRQPRRREQREPVGEREPVERVLESSRFALELAREDRA